MTKNTYKIYNKVPAYKLFIKITSVLEFREGTRERMAARQTQNKCKENERLRKSVNK
jgi:hypothetical protein